MHIRSEKEFSEMSLDDLGLLEREARTTRTTRTNYSITANTQQQYKRPWVMENGRVRYDLHQANTL